MARKLTPEEVIKPGVRKLTEAELLSDLNPVQRGLEGIRQFNIGVMEPFGAGDNRFTQQGPTPPGQRPETVGRAGMRMMGNAAGITAATLLPGLRLAAGARTAAPAVAPATALVPALRSYGTEVGARALANPGTFFTLELGSGFAAGAAGGAVAQDEHSPTTRLIAELVGGAAFPLGASAAGKVADLSPAVNLAKQAITTFRNPTGVTAAGRNRALTRVQELEPDAAGAVRRAETANVLEDAPLSFAELSESPGLLSLQKSVADSTDRLTTENQQRFAEINRVTQRALQTLGDTNADAPVNVAETRAYLQTLLDERIRISRVAYDEALEKASPQTTREMSNMLARRELDGAYDAALAQEKELWEAVELDVPATFSATERVYKQFLNNLQRDRVAATRNNIPVEVRQALGQLDEETGQMVGGLFRDQPPTARELQSLRSRMLDLAKAERAKPAPDRRKLSLIASMQEAVLDDLSKLEGVSEPLAVARGFSADLNARFRQGEIGDLLGFSRDGASAVPAALTLESTLGLSGARGEFAANELLQSVARTANTEEMSGHMQNFLREEFLNFVRRGGDFSPQAAQTYIQKTRRQVLNLFPELRKEFEQVMMTGQTKVAQEKLRDPVEAAAALVLNATPGKEISRVLSSSNPSQTMQQVMELANTDPTGRAGEGMRRAVSEYLLDRAAVRQGGDNIDVTDTPYLSGSKLRELLSNPAIRGAIDQTLGPEQIARLDQIANTAVKLDLGRKAAAADNVINDKEALIMNFIRRIGAGTLGSQINKVVGAGGNIQNVSMVVKASERLRERGLDPARVLLTDAITSRDPTLMRALLTESPGAQGPRNEFVTRQLNAWAIGAMERYAIDMQDEE